MPTITLSTLRTSVRKLGDYENSSRITDAFLTEVINRSLADYYELMSNSHQGYFDKVGTVSTVANTQTVNLPSDFYDLRAIDRDLGSSRFVPLRRLSMIETYRYPGTGTPVGYMLFGGTAPGTVRLFPIPSAVITLRLTYEPLFTALSADGDSFDFRNGHEQIVIYGALVELDVREERDASTHLALLERHKERVRTSAAKRDSNEPEYLVSRDESWDLLEVLQ